MAPAGSAAAQMAGPAWARPRVRLVLAGFAGLAVAAGQAPLSAWWLAVPALVLVTALVASGLTAKDRLTSSFAAGFGCGAGALFWIVEPFFVDPWRHGWMAPFAILLMAAGMGVFWSLAGAVAGLGRSPASRAFGFALGLAASDLLRSYVFTGFPWALVGHIWIGTPVMQLAAWTGPIGLGLLTTLAATLPVAGRGAVARGGLAGLAVILLGAVWAGGAARLNTPAGMPADPVRVRLVQPNAAQHLKWRGDMWRIFLDRQMEMTGEPAPEPLDLIVWPETAVPFLLGNVGSLPEEMTLLSRGVPIAFGIQREDGARFYNSLAVTDAKGRVTEVYDKWHLVPFGEYVPGGDLFASFGITAFAAQAGNGYSAGQGARVIDLGRAGKVLPLICYEAIFPQDLRAAGTRADWVLQVTNDSWFGDLAGPYQHLAQARLRAVEQGLPVLRAANTGVSAAIDPYGRIVESLPLNEAGFVDVAVPAPLPPTFYARTGEWPSLALIVILMATMLVVARRKAD